jgi:hypothetical protein
MLTSPVIDPGLAALLPLAWLCAGLVAIRLFGPKEADRPDAAAPRERVVAPSR